MSLDTIERHLSQREDELFRDVGYETLRRRAQRAARRPIWAAVATFAIAAANLWLWWDMGRTSNLLVAIGVVFVAQNRWQGVTKARVRLAELASGGDVLTSLRRDLRRTMASRLLSAVFWALMVPLWTFAALFGKHPEAAGTVAVISLLLSAWALFGMVRAARELAGYDVDDDAEAGNGGEPA